MAVCLGVRVERLKSVDTHGGCVHYRVEKNEGVIIRSVVLLSLLEIGGKLQLLLTGRTWDKLIIVEVSLVKRENGLEGSLVFAAQVFT
ncbi:hypothetical protein SMAC4_13852 [Sordaria macrospora]|uniref:uncharacterized protein n=1 Tax=Sordaria macrospora TaxID=5147 RepID=UPI002B2C9FEE|nr:hypothetical protein SMAC4_13852 [Sordaria macrospora]